MYCLSILLLTAAGAAELRWWLWTTAGNWLCILRGCSRKSTAITRFMWACCVVFCVFKIVGSFLCCIFECDCEFSMDVCSPPAAMFYNLSVQIHILSIHPVTVCINSLNITAIAAVPPLPPTLSSCSVTIPCPELLRKVIMAAISMKSKPNSNMVFANVLIQAFILIC